MTQISEPSTVSVSDAALLQRFVASHDEAAFNALVQRYGPMVLGICRRILHQQSDADDAFQATFLLLALKAKQIREPHLLGNWLFGVGTRTSIGIRRSNYRRVVQEKRLMRILRPRRQEKTKDLDLRMMLDEQISKLPEKLRQVIVCCHLEGLTKREAAERLNIKDSTIMQRLKLAREMLKRRLGARGVQLTETSMGTILVAVAVPVALSSGTVKAATVVASGKAAAAGVATGKAAGLSKGASNVVLAAKLKLAASLLLAGGLVVTGAAAVAPLVASPAAAAPQSVILTTPAATRPTATQATEEDSPKIKKSNRIRKLLLSIIMASQRGSMPADLKALNFNDPEFEYLGRRGLNGISMDSDTAIIFQRPAPGYQGALIVGFIDGHVALVPQRVVQQIRDHSLKVIEATATGRKVPPDVLPPSTRPTSQVAMPSEIQAALESNATNLAPLDVAWTKTGFSGLTPEEAATRYDLHPSYFAAVQRRSIWAQGKWYDWTQRPNNASSEYTFDGSAWSYISHGTVPKVMRNPISQMNGSGRIIEMGYLERAGLHLPANGPELRADVALSTVLLQLKAGASMMAVDRMQVDGHPCERLTLLADNPDRLTLHSLPADRTFIYDLDPVMNYAIRHEEQRYGQQLLETTDNENFRKLQGRNVWLPFKSTSRYYTYPMMIGEYFQEPILGETFEVTDLKQQPVAEDQFVLKATGGAVQLAAAAPSAPSNIAHTGVLAGVQTAGSPPIESSSWRWIVAGVAGVGAIVLVVFGIRRYRGAAG